MDDKDHKFTLTDLSYQVHVAMVIDQQVDQLAGNNPEQPWREIKAIRHMILKSIRYFKRSSREENIAASVAKLWILE